MQSLIRGAVILALLASCGGGSGSTDSDKSYDFVTPQLSAERTYGRTIIDNSNNTINETYTDTVTGVNVDGTYVVFEEDPNHDSVTVNGTTYAITTETIDANSSGQATSYSYTAADGSAVTCTYVPHAAGPEFPLQVGQSWTLDFTLTCGSNAPLAYTQVGSVIDVESVTVPAGTFMALKLQSTLSWTDHQGTMHTQTITNWRDITTMYSVEEEISISYSGVPPAHGYPVSVKNVLQSMS